MQQVSTSMVVEGATEAEKAANAAENKARTALMSDQKFKNIFKFVQFVFDAACKNSKLFSGKFSFLNLIILLLIQYVCNLCNHYCFQN